MLKTRRYASITQYQIIAVTNLMTTVDLEKYVLKLDSKTGDLSGTLLGTVKLKRKLIWFSYLRFFVWYWRNCGKINESFLETHFKICLLQIKCKYLIKYKFLLVLVTQWWCHVVLNINLPVFYSVSEPFSENNLKT